MDLVLRAVVSPQFNAVTDVWAPCDRGWDRGCDVQSRCALLQGIVVAVDRREAFKRFKRSAEAGHAPAQSNLGVAYNGGVGIVVDIRKSFKRYKRAA